jgi:hypothetical protein
MAASLVVPGNINGYEAKITGFLRSSLSVASASEEHSACCAAGWGSPGVQAPARGERDDLLEKEAKELHRGSCGDAHRSDSSASQRLA